MNNREVINYIDSKQADNLSFCEPSQALHRIRPRKLPKPRAKSLPRLSIEGKSETIPTNTALLPVADGPSHLLAESALDSPRRSSDLVSETMTEKATAPASVRKSRPYDQKVSDTKRKRSTDSIIGISTKKRRVIDGDAIKANPVNLRRGEVRYDAVGTLSAAPPSDDEIYTSQFRRDSKSWSSASGSSKSCYGLHARSIESPPSRLGPNPKHPPPSRLQVITWKNELNTIEYLISQGKGDERDEEKLHKVLLKIEGANFTKQLLRDSGLVNALKKMIEDRGFGQRVLNRLECILHSWSRSKLI